MWVIVFVLYILTVGQTSWERTTKSAFARDYATYHYAIQVASYGGNPYHTKLLSQRGRVEGKNKKNIEEGQWVKLTNRKSGRVKDIVTEEEYHRKGIMVRLENGTFGRVASRSGVHPYFYPPPSLVGMLWAKNLSLINGYLIFFLLNQVGLFASLFMLHRWLKLPVWILGIICLTFTPIPDSNSMGQVNFLVLPFLIFAMWKGSGWVLSIAAMIKMSPAILLVPYGLWKEKKMVFGAILGAIALSVLGLSLVGLDEQWYFYTKVLPQFSSGQYLGLSVGINLDGNHSIPDVFNRLYPHPDPQKENVVLSLLAKRLSTTVLVFSVLALSLLAKVTTDGFGRLCVLGAFMSLMVVTPVYAYEHHLVFMIVPIAIVAQAFRLQRIGRMWMPIAVICYVILAWKWGHLRENFHLMRKDGYPVLASFMREGKFLGCVLIGMLCVLGATGQTRTKDRESVVPQA